MSERNIPDISGRFVVFEPGDYLRGEVVSEAWVAIPDTDFNAQAAILFAHSEAMSALAARVAKLEAVMEAAEKLREFYGSNGLYDAEACSNWGADLDAALLAAKDG